MKKLIFILSVFVCIMQVHAQYTQIRKYIAEDPLTNTVTRYDYYTAKTYINTKFNDIRLDAPQGTTFGGDKLVDVGIYDTNNQLIRKYEFTTNESQDGTSLYLNDISSLSAKYEKIEPYHIKDLGIYGYIYKENNYDYKKELIDFILNDYGYIRFYTTTYGGYTYDVKIWTIKKNTKKTVTNFEEIDRNIEKMIKEKFVADSLLAVSKFRNEFIKDSLRKDSLCKYFYKVDSIKYANLTEPVLIVDKKPIFINEQGITFEQFIKQSNNIFLKIAKIYCIINKEGVLTINNYYRCSKYDYAKYGVKGKKINQDILEGIELLKKTKWIPGKKQGHYDKLFNVNTKITIDGGHY